ncbi:MAG: hypothetical protein EKK41_18275 [Hyphomicrobiales bacterium]|nr:MAG: hypothetical protein EKK41_18275 [Hyphomicrobiales bacterium]
MTRKTKALSGASQDAYFRRVLKTYPDLPEDARERIVRQLRSEIAQLRIRTTARESALAAHEDAQREPAAVAKEPAPAAGPALEAFTASAPSAPIELPRAAPFDPFAINVIVVLRTEGKDAALEALNAVADADNLRLLAREQRLSVDEDLVTPEALSAAIVAAAERRIANRRAAAG